MKKSDKKTVQYALIGSGRIAKHLAFYWNTLGLPVQTWSRSEPLKSLRETVKDCSHILLAISDSAIEAFIEENAVLLENKILVHFSGSLNTQHAYAAHPLLTFSTELYPVERYLQIPFIIEQGGPPFEHLLPGLPNTHFVIKPEWKAYYHSLCVLSGNFTVLLWQKFFKELESRFAIPSAVALPYLEQISINLQTHPAQSLSGPLARGDFSTIQKNLDSLHGDPFQRVYVAFLEAFQLSEGFHQGVEKYGAKDGLGLPKVERGGNQDFDCHCL